MNLTVDTVLSAEDSKALGQGLTAFNKKLLGGLTAETYWGWLYIDILWVSEKKRDQGLGWENA